MENVTMTLPEIINFLRAAATSDEAFGSDFNVTETSDWYGINWPVAVISRYMLDYMQNRFDNLELRKSEDPYFWGQSANFLFYRKVPDYAVSYQMEATNPTIGATASAGQIQIKKQNTDLVYINTDPITVDTVPFVFKARCSEVGTIGNAEIDEVNEIQTTPANWGDTFTNNAAFEGGQDLETLEEGRKRYFNQESQTTFWNEDGIYSDLIKLSGVNSVNVVQNREDITVDGIPRRAVHVVVDGGVKGEIIQSLYRKVLPATYTLGAEREDVTTLSGDTVNIGFDRPTIIDTDYTISLYPVDTVPQSFKDAVEEYGASIPINGVITSEDAGCYVKDNVTEASNYDSIYVTFKKSIDPTYTHVIPYGSNEKPNLIEGA